MSVCSDIVPKANTFCRYITSGPSGLTLDFRAAKREDANMLRELYAIVEALRGAVAAASGRGEDGGKMLT